MNWREALRKTMRKAVNQTLVLMLVVCLLLALAAFRGFSMAGKLGGGVSDLQASIQDKTQGQGELSDPEGWALILEALGVGLGSVGMVFFQVLAGAVFAVAAILLFLTLLARWLVSKGTKGRILAYRILMGLACLILGLLLLPAKNLCSALGFKATLQAVLILLALLGTLINTYTRRLRNALTDVQLDKESF